MKKILIVAGDYYKDITKGLLNSALKELPKNFKVKIIVLIGEYRDSWLRRYNKVSIKSHLDYMYSMTKILSLKNSPSLEYKTWLEYKEYEKEIDHNKTFILFNRKVKNRRPIYTHAINLTNHIRF